MSPSQSKFFLTTPIYYVNARPHIGHAYTTIVADVLARRSRAQGVDTWFLTGTDEHGQKIERSAQAAGIPPQQFADQVSAEFRALWQRMGITNDDFIRTTEPRHKRGAQKLFADLHAAGHIYLSTYTGQYSIGEEMFVDGPPGTIGPDGRPTETVTEENFFFRLSAFQLPLLDLIESDTLKIRPESSRNEVLGFLRGNISGAPQTHVILSDVARKARDESKDPEEAGATQTTKDHLPPFPSSEARPSFPVAAPDPIEPTGPTDIPSSTTQEPAPTDSALSPSPYLYSAQGTPYIPGALRDLSVSRSSFTWGIPVPEPAASEASQKHVIYVWLDALANYMTAVGYGSDTPEDQAKFARYWPANLHLVGKEITRFHCVYWPAFLLALNPALRQQPGQPMPILSPEEHRLWAEHMLPKEVVANGWLLFDNSKMSKSKGNIVRTETILDAFGTLCPPPPPSLLSFRTLSGPKGEESTPALGIASGLRPTEQSNPLEGALAPGSAAPPTHVILSGVAGSASDESKHPEEANVTHTAEDHSATSGAPSSTRREPWQGGVSDEVRPLSSPAATSEKGGSSGLHPAEQSASPSHVILSDAARSAGDESKDPEESNATHTARNHSPRTLFSPSTQTQKGESSGLQPADQSPSNEGASAPATPTPHQRDLFAADVLRYYLLREIPFGQDGSFSFEALITRYNADLANGYGNLVSRTLTLIRQSLSSEILEPERPWSSPSTKDFVTNDEIRDSKHAFSGTEHVIQLINEFPKLANVHIENRLFQTLISSILLRVGIVDGYISSNAPWKLAKSNDPESRKKLIEVLYTAAESIRIITALLHPILPYATASVWAQLGLGSIEAAAAGGELKNLSWGGLQPGTKLGPLAPIFPRADKGLAQIMADMETQKDLKLITDSADAATPSTTEFKEAPIASLTGQRFEAPAEEHHAPTHPAAPPRTSSLAEPNPGQQVAASAAHSTERPSTPSHTEAPASGIFSAPFIPEPHPGMSGSTPEFSQTTSPATCPADAFPQITIDDFAKIELRVAQILVCERIPKADKLLRLEVDLGYEKRQILSGIAEWYTPEDLIGRRIVVITNLAPRKMRGLESHGMLLAASAEPSAEGEKPGKPHLATFADSDSLPLGSRLK